MAGKTHARWIRVSVGDASGNPQDISGDVTEVNIPIVYDDEDVTGFSDGVHNVEVGHPTMELTMSGVFNNTATTGAHSVLSGIVGYVGANAPVTVTIQIGIRAAPTAGDPEFEGSYFCTEYTVNPDLTWGATFKPGSGTAPAWGTV